jgi:hypothetical protein
MAWLRFLSQVSFLIIVAVDAVVLCHVYPAFRRTRNKAFVFIAVACVVGIIDSVYDHTVNLQALNNHDYIIARTFRRFTNFADNIFWGLGVVLLVRSYLNTRASITSEGAQPDPVPDGGSPAEDKTQC